MFVGIFGMSMEWLGISYITLTIYFFFKLKLSQAENEVDRLSVGAWIFHLIFFLFWVFLAATELFMLNQVNQPNFFECIYAIVLHENEHGFETNIL